MSVCCIEELPQDIHLLVESTFGEDHEVVVDDIFSLYGANYEHTSSHLFFILVVPKANINRDICKQSRDGSVAERDHLCVKETLINKVILLKSENQTEFFDS